ncbi:MAG: hypothetical protein PVI90_01625 [Desulfobacteraceae bacterium]
MPQDCVGYSSVVEALNTVHIGIFAVFGNKEDGEKTGKMGELIFSTGLKTR